MPTNCPLSGHSAVVTGAAQGIGAAIAQRLYAEGAAVALLDRDIDRGRGTATSLDPTGERAFFLACDLRLEAEVENAFKATVDRLGRLDVLVNNAGINAYFDASTMTMTDWDTVLDVDLKGSWLCAKHALPHLLIHRSSSIINIGSIHGRLTSAGMFPYAAAKAGVEGLTRSLALDYGPQGIRVNAVAPGWTRTQLVQDWLDRSDDPAAEERRILDAHPLRRIVEPSEVAAAVAFLAGPSAAAITGAVIPVDCGLSARFAV